MFHENIKKSKCLQTMNVNQSGVAYFKVSQRSKRLAPSFHSQEKNLEKHNYKSDK